MNYSGIIRQERNDFEALMSDVLESDIPLLNDINRYLLDHSGKKIRPLLSLLTAKALGEEVCREVVVCAAVCELIHTSTLLHDDVVDESDLRRMAPTVRAKYSQGASVLMGDYWLSRAICLLTSNNCCYEIIKLFSRTLGDLAEGEMFQMERAIDLRTTFEDYYRIIRLKTASLFISSIKSAAIASHATAALIEELGLYAAQLGLAFQIRDDILDYSSSSVSGKDSDSDIEERKITLPLLCALGCASEEEKRKILSEIGKITPEAATNGAIVALVKDFVQTRHGIEKASEILREHICKALAHLEVLPESEAKKALAEVVKSLEYTV